MSEIRFAGYRIVDTVSTGAISTIYKAVQEPLGRTVALKTLSTQIASTSSFGEQLDRESKVLADIVHPNVVLVLEATRTTSGRPYIVFEWVDGPSLQDVLASVDGTAPRRGARDKGQRRKGLEVPAALAIACGICAALEHIHERGVVHRDLKPSNVLLSRTGHVKLIDFGIAQRPRTSDTDLLGSEGITASGRIAPEQMKDAFGTPAYMSPEQILGDFVDGRSDLFSLGVLLYQMLSGTRPFEAPGKEGDSKRSAAQRIRRDAPAALRERAPHVPRAVERIVMRLLEKSPDDRYPSAGVVVERLEHALRAETREDPAVLIRAALGEPSHDREAKSDGKGAATPKDRAKKSEAKRAPSSPRIAARPPISLRRALLAFAAIALLFVIGVTAIEGTSAQAREARSTGAQVLELAPDHAGGLRVVATPWAYVRVDGQLVETTPFARAIPLAAGKHFVTLTHPEATPIEREVTVVVGETVTLDVTMNMFAEDAGRDAR